MRKGALLLLVTGISICISCTDLRATQVTLTPPETAPSAVSDNAIDRIKKEGLNHSQVMPLLSYLTDVIGPHLTGSPNLKRANEWTRDKLASWGVSDTHLEAWGPFGRGWSLKRFSAQILSPQTIPLVAYPLAWSPGFKQSKTGSVVYVDAKTEAELHNFQGKLKGAFVLLSPPIELQPHFEPQATRISDKQLQEWDTMMVPPEEAAPAAPPDAKRKILDQFYVKRSRFLLEEGVAAILYPSFPGDGGAMRVFQAFVPQPYDTPRDKILLARDVHAPRITPQVVVATEQYNRLFRMMEAGEKLRLAMEFAVQFHETNLMAYNTQDDLDYFTRVMPFNQDVYDRVPADDLKQVATVMAVFVYNAAMRDEKIPRKIAH